MNISALPPVAAPIAWKVILKAMLNRNHLVRHTTVYREVQAYFGSQALFWVSSGRAAMFILLAALMENSLKREVILPAYTCPTVYYAIRKAGLEPKFCDIDPANLGLETQNLTQLTSKKTLSIVAHHLFGIPCCIEDIAGLGTDLGIPVIEDIAQGLGAEVDGKKVGCFGDLAFFSLGKGKVITADHGGVILVNSKIHLNGLYRNIQGLSPLSQIESVRSMVALIAYPVILSSFFWWLMEKTHLNPEYVPIPENFEVKLLSDFQVAFASLVFKEVDGLNGVRLRNGEYLLRELGPMNHILLPQMPDNHKPVFLRFPVLFKDIKTCDHVYHKLSRWGLGVSRMTPYRSTVDFAHTQGEFPNARFVSQRILTLPTHHRVKRRHLDTILSVINDFA